jgi:hypothetical protein
MIMSEKGTTSTEKAMRILQRAESRKVALRLVGGMAIRLHCHGTHSSHLREYGDIDVCGLKKEEMGIFAVLQELSYSPNSRFNLLYGETRLQFIHEGDNRSVDVFLDKFKMEHTLDFRQRLELDDLTISVTDLLLTKLQIVRITEKDLRDIVAIVEDHELGHSDNRETINLDYIAELCSRDWGLHKTVTGNLKMMSAHIEEVLPGFKSGSELVPRLDTILKSILARQKTVRWRVRNLIGEKMKWYEIVSVGEGEVY